MKEYTNLVGELVTWVWVITLSAWGGAVSYLHKITKYNLKFKVVRFIVELLTSSFVGILTYLLCESANLPPGTMAALVGISGHMGTRALFSIEKKYEAVFGKEDEK